MKHGMVEKSIKKVFQNRKKHYTKNSNMMI